MAKQTARLSHNDLIRILRHLDAGRDLVEPMSREEVIKMIRDDLGITVTKGNIDGIRKIEGYEWVCPSVRTPPPVAGKNDAFLAAQVLELFEQLNIQAPDRLEEMAAGRTHG